MVKSIYLQDGEEIFVDDEDYERVSQYTWQKVYVLNSRKINTMVNKKVISLKEFIQKGSHQIEIGNDFTRKNLTKIGSSQKWKAANCKGSSKYKGVSWVESRKRWMVNITVGNERKYLGSYKNEDEAGKAYNQGVLDYWGGEGYLNVIGEDNRTVKRNYKTYGTQNKRRVGKIGYRGVRINSNGTITVQKNIRKSKIYAGTFKTTHHAALAYNKCVQYLYGDDAILNDVPMTDELKEFITNWEIPEKIKQLKD